MKDYRNAGKSKKNEFTWMVEHSKGIDKHMGKIHNGLRNDTLEELIRKSDNNMDKRYRQLYNTCRSNVREQNPWEKESMLINLDKNLHNGRIRHNLLMSMYEQKFNELPFYKRWFTKKIKSDYYEVTTKVKL
jgi:hypothetical protein